MQMLKNRHLVVAMIVAPILAIIAYFATDYVVSEKPAAALPGESYRLAAMPSCRYQSGFCTLKNGELEVTVHAQRIGDSRIKLILRSELPVNNALISVVYADEASPPSAMQDVSEEPGTLGAILTIDNPENSLIRLVVELSETLYYAETTAVFVDYRTSFPRDNFSTQ